MIWNVCTFYNELDVLEIRLATLDHLVDRFVIAEADVNQRGQPKPLYLAPELESGGRFDRWLPKIRYVAVRDMPDRQDDEGMAAHWERENYQRNCLARGMSDLAEDDLVLISDMDEIPYPAALEEGLYRPPLRFPMDMHVYRLNWRWAERPVTDGSTAVVQRGAAFDGRGVHDVLLGVEAPWRSLDDRRASSGWHLAYQGDAEQIRRKVLAIADDGYAQLVPDEKKAARLRESWTSLAWADHCVLTGEDVFGRDHRAAEWVDLDQLPPYVGENRERFAHLLVSPLAACTSRPGCDAPSHLTTCPEGAREW